MKRPFIVASALIGLSSGAPAEVFRYTSENGDQEHHMSMELQSGMPDMKGGWSFTDPEGQVRQLTYSAGIEGFVPKADYLPEPVEPLEGNKIAQVKSNQDFK